jgi:predicted nucleic-acid-binding Zn-ribbon protein
MTRRKKIREFITNIKKTKSCVRCGNDDFRVLDFHHIREKSIGISEIQRAGWAESKILKEIEKCEVLCSNCHRIHHYENK